MIEVGAYDQAWPDWHLGPEQALLAHQLVKGKVLLPIHWGLFDLAYHAWTEPMERLLSLNDNHHFKIATPMPGGSIEPDNLEEAKRWWPEVSFQSAKETPIIATKSGDKDDRY